jgi:hypothetical protein
MCHAMDGVIVTLKKEKDCHNVQNEVPLPASMCKTAQKLHIVKAEMDTAHTTVFTGSISSCECARLLITRFHKNIKIVD